jgi:hypothetical protein
MLEFFCFDPEIANTMPIIPTSELKYDWIEKAKEHYKNFPDRFETSKCPGIISVMNRGWVQRAYQDICIETNGNPKDFIGSVKEKQIEKRGGKYMSGYISNHSHEQLWSFKKNWPKETLHCMLKIQSPWIVKVPKGYSLLTLPIPYAEDVRFTAATGFFKGTQYLSVQIFWHCLNSIEVIKAGTPLNQMILVKDEKVDMEQKVMYDVDEFMKEEFPEIYSKVK